MKEAIIYHSRDLDGISSCVIFLDWWNRQKFDNVELTTLGWDYGNDIPDLSEYDKVTMCDISFPVEKMKELYNKLNDKFIYIDHHISAIKDLEQNKLTSIVGLRDASVAATELTWKYFNPNTEIPLSIELLGMYDSWRNHDKDKWDNMILPFQYGMRLTANNIDNFNNKLLYDDTLVDKIIEVGKNILKYQSQIDDKLCKDNSFECEFHGYKAICLNGGGFNSGVFKSMYDENKHDIMIPFMYNGNEWKFSLYSTKKDVDCSKLAKLYGGGGHFSAAGFQIDDVRKIFNI